MQRVLVHQPAARDVHQHRAALQLRQRLGIDDLVRRRSGRRMQRQEIAVRQHLVERCKVPRALLQIRRQPVARMIHHRHVEAARPLRHRPPDAPHPQNAERLAVHPHTQQVALADPIAPAGTHDLVVMIGTPRRRQQHHEGEVGGALGQHVRRVGHDQAPRLRRRDIDVVVADAAGGADTHARRQPRDRIRGQRQRIGEHDRIGPVRAGRLDHLVRGHVVLALDHDGIEFLPRPRHHVARHQGGKHQS